MSNTTLVGAGKQVPSFEELMMKRDYIGARTLLEVSKFLVIEYYSFLPICIVFTIVFFFI